MSDMSPFLPLVIPAVALAVLGVGLVLVLSGAWLLDHGLNALAPIGRSPAMRSAWLKVKLVVILAAGFGLPLYLFGAWGIWSWLFAAAWAYSTLAAIAKHHS